MLTGFSPVNFSKENTKFLNTLKNTNIIVVAPASGADSEALKNIQQIANLKLETPAGCFDANQKTAFHANTDKKRLSCLSNALLDKSADVIWNLRGGYGSAKLIQELHKLPKPNKEKFFIGYSDITALHLFLTQEWGWKTIHGAMITELLKDDKAKSNFSQLADIVTDKVEKLSIKGLLPLNLHASGNKSINGSLTGGNLTVVQTSIGTMWQIKSDGKILFLEDVNMIPYHVDRSLYHLLQAGIFKNAKAVIFGEFSTDDALMRKTLKTFAEILPIPVFKSERFGHGKVNDPLVYNVDSDIIQKGDNFDLIMKLK